ncbi:MAG: CPBP family intramembrane glutamic endopeptidase [Pseudomonadota bacterium]
MIRVGLAFFVTAIAHGFAFRESLQGTTAFWLWIAVPALLLAALAVHHFWDTGTLGERLLPRWGDLSIGALTALVLLVASWVARGTLSPSGTVRQSWLYRVYLQIGDPEALQTSAWLTSAILLVAAAEEIIWRGMVLDLLSARVGARRGWILAAVLYGLAMIPTLYTLRDPIAGPNPLLLIAALGCGIVWSFLAARLGRLAPGIFSHMAFAYFSAAQFRWPGI